MMPNNRFLISCNRFLISCKRFPFSCNRVPISCNKFLIIIIGTGKQDIFEDCESSNDVLPLISYEMEMQGMWNQIGQE